jgi:hypothetical protein
MIGAFRLMYVAGCHDVQVCLRISVGISILDGVGQRCIVA